MTEYFDFLDKMRKAKIDITRLFILECIECQNCDKYSKETLVKMVEYIYEAWLGVEDINLARLCDATFYNWKKIKEENISSREIINYLYDIDYEE